jgi:hypothetical protein
MASWEDLQTAFYDNNLTSLSNIVKDLIVRYGKDNVNTIFAELRKAPEYKERFAGNEELRKQGKLPLTEAEYLSTEKAYEETLASYGAQDFSTPQNKAKWISGSVSPRELSDRFSVAYTKVNTAASGQDKALLDELKKMYPGVTDMELTKTLLLGKEGSEYLKSKLSIAEIKAAETEVGLPSALGAEFLSSQGVNREIARAGMSKVASRKAGISTLASIYEENAAPEELQKELESENILGTQAGAKTKKLASQARAQFKGQSGVTSGSLKRTRSGSL